VGYVIVTTLLLYWLIQRNTIALRESDERWHSLVGATPDFIALHDHEGRFLYLNHAEGFSENDALGRYAHEFVAPESREMFVGKMEESLRTWTTQKFEHTAMGDHGALKIYEQYLIPMIQKNKEVNILSIARDITERKQAEEALKDSKARMASIIHSAMDTLSQDNRNALALNPAAEKCFIQPTIMGQSLDTLVPELYRAKHHKQIENSNKRNYQSSYEWVYGNNGS
jgi:PAS domain S-box-containing protein